MQGKIAGIIKNDFAAAPGVCLTIFVQGCPLKCYNCQNPEQQDFNGGKPYDFAIQEDIINSIKANGLLRPLAIMGGEPCCNENSEFTAYLITMIRTNYPNLPVYVWTGYTIEVLAASPNPNIQQILATADFLIDGPYLESQRDITLPMRGSRNQRVIDLNKRRQSHDSV